jgi:6-phosphogluconate dehydrogenase
MKKSNIGLIGLAVMGANLARNIASKGYKISVYNRTSEKTEAFISNYPDPNLNGTKSLKEFVDSLETPRKIIIMVKAGKAVDMVIKELVPLLEQDDIIIDCGNSFYQDTIRREKELRTHKLRFFGCGVSGGEEGALNGPSLMPGGELKAFDQLAPILKDISAKDFNGNPCVCWLGENGAGHYVKMVHNGIEYAIMQLMAEAYDLLKTGYRLTAPDIADIFDSFQNGRLESYLMEIAVPVLSKRDEFSQNWLIDMVLDAAQQKATGRWTAIEGMERNSDTQTIGAAVFARSSSMAPKSRKQLSGIYKKPEHNPVLPLDKFCLKLEHALYAGFILAYWQGFQLMAKAAKEQENWEYSFSGITRIWQGGCIIRANLLKTLQQVTLENGNCDLMQTDTIRNELENSIPALREIVSAAIHSAIPCPGFSSALSSFDMATTERCSANFIQGLRDCFGAHTYERTDRDGTFHSEWEK